MIYFLIIIGILVYFSIGLGITVKLGDLNKIVLSYAGVCVLFWPFLLLIIFVYCIADNLLS